MLNYVWNGPLKLKEASKLISDLSRRELLRKNIEKRDVPYFIFLSCVCVRIIWIFFLYSLTAKGQHTDHLAKMSTITKMMKATLVFHRKCYIYCCWTCSFRKMLSKEVWSWSLYCDEKKFCLRLSDEENWTEMWKE